MKKTNYLFLLFLILLLVFVLMYFVKNYSQTGVVKYQKIQQNQEIKKEKKKLKNKTLPKFNEKTGLFEIPALKLPKLEEAKYNGDYLISPREVLITGVVYGLFNCKDKLNFDKCSKERVSRTIIAEYVGKDKELKQKIIDIHGRTDFESASNLNGEYYIKLYPGKWKVYVQDIIDPKKKYCLDQKNNCIVEINSKKDIYKKDLYFYLEDDIAKKIVVIGNDKKKENKNRDIILNEKGEEVNIKDFIVY